MRLHVTSQIRPEWPIECNACNGAGRTARYSGGEYMKYKLHFTLRWLIIALSILTITAAGWADTKRGDISTYELEDLLRVPVTSVTKTEQKVANSPAAVFVITREDIRHSGMTSVPELLRMVPGLDVAHINASQWAVSSRGFNARFDN